MGNEESDRLAKLGANKQDPDKLDLEIPPEFNIQGAKLATLMQAMAYKGTLERKKTGTEKLHKKQPKTHPKHNIPDNKRRRDRRGELARHTKTSDTTDHPTVLL